MLVSLGALVTACWGGRAAAVVNGKPASPGEYAEVALLTLGSAKCSGTLIGPRVVVTAAQCFRQGETVTVTLGGKTYSGRVTNNPVFPATDHNVALVMLNAEVTGVKPATVGGEAQTGLGITMAGFGCTEPGGQGPDGRLHFGDNVITGFRVLEFIAQQPGGAAMCYQDLGGPAFVRDAEQRRRLLGIASRGNLRDRTQFARLDIAEARTFFTLFLSQNPAAKICGVANHSCGDEPAPPPPAPTCLLSATPANVKPNERVTLTLLASGRADSATIDGESVTLPNGYRNVTQSQPGTYTARGVVRGPGGEGRCETTYVVEGAPQIPDPPTCVMTASPSVIRIHEQTTVEITATGNVETALIDNVSVAIPVGKRIFRGERVGTVTVNGEVRGPGGRGFCSVAYVVQGNDPIIPPGPHNFTVVPVYCGKNTLETSVSRVCLAVLKREAAVGDMQMNQVVRIQYADGGVEVLPILARKNRPSEPGELWIFEDLFLYANVVIPAPGAEVLDTREALLTKQLGRSQQEAIPVAIQGRGGRNQAFYVERLEPPTTAPTSRARVSSGAHR
jgi:hypothetical protein